MAKLGKLNLEEEKVSKLEIGAAGGIKLEEKMKQVVQKILAQTQARIEKAKANGKKAAATISGGVQKHGKKAIAVMVAGGMAASLAACAPTKTPEQEKTNPPSQPSHSTPGSQETPKVPKETPTQEIPKETPTQEVPGTETPKETPTQEIPSTETPSQETPTQEGPGAGLTTQEYIDSITAELNMKHYTAELAKEYLDGLLRQIDELCVKYNCTAEDIEAHKKMAVTKYFEGIPERLKESELSGYEIWKSRGNTAQKDSWDMHKGLNR